MQRQHQPSFHQLWLLLLVALVVFSPVIFKLTGMQQWLHWGEKPNQPNPSAIVWATKQTGFYYCRDSTLYGKALPGSSMTQQQALGQGYRPADGRYCP